MDKGYKMIRVITVAPLLALVMIVIVAGNCEGIFLSLWQMIYSLFFLSIMPLLAYPLQKHIPAYKEKGREGQRNLAIIFAAAGISSSSPFPAFWIVCCCGRRYSSGSPCICGKHRDEAPYPFSANRRRIGSIGQYGCGWVIFLKNTSQAPLKISRMCRQLGIRK